MKMKILVVAAATVVASSAMAQSAFEGFYAQAGIGYESTSVNPTGGRTANGNSYSSSFNDSNSANVSVGVGNYFSITPTFLLGIGAEYNPLPGNKENYTVTGTGFALKGKYTKKDSYSIFLSPAFAINKSGLAYAKLGYTGLTLKDEPTGSASSNTNYNGYMLGLGYRQIVQGGLYGFVETNYAQYDSKSDTSGNTGSTKPKTMNVMLGMGYKF